MKFSTRFSEIVSAFAMLCLLLVSGYASAAPVHQENSGLCQRIGSSSEFVKEAIGVCLHEPPSRRAGCYRESRELFNRCGFEGDFKTIRRRLEARIVLLSFFRSMSPRQSSPMVASNVHYRPADSRVVNVVGAAALCIDSCGNGRCEEIVCQGTGCPCAETPESCPKDCAH